MHAQDHQLDGKSFKRFVAHLVKAEKQRLLPGEAAKPRSLHQEEVAVFWGFTSWIDLWTRVVTNRSMVPPKRLAAPLAERPFTARRLPGFWRWTKDKGVTGIGLNVGKPLTANQPPRYSELAVASKRTMQKEDIEGFLHGLMGTGFDLSVFPEGDYQFMTSDRTCHGTPLGWRAELHIQQAKAPRLRLLFQPTDTVSEKEPIVLRDYHQGMLVVSHSHCRRKRIRLRHLVDAHLNQASTTPVFCYRPPSEFFHWNPPVSPSHFDLIETTASNTRYTETQREALAGQSYALCIERCEDKDTLHQSLSDCEAGRLVFMGVAGGDDQHGEESLQRVPDAFVRLLHRADPKTWRAEARRLITVCHAVAATCYSRNQVEVTETLVFTDSIRHVLLDALKEAAIPEDLYPLLAHLTLAHGHDFVEDAIAQGLPDRELSWIKHVQAEWQQLWAPDGEAKTA